MNSGMKCVTAENHKLVGTNKKVGTKSKSCKNPFPRSEKVDVRNRSESEYVILLMVQFPDNNVGYDSEAETVTIRCTDSGAPYVWRVANVACDSGVAMIRDVMSHIH